MLSTAEKLDPRVKRTRGLILQAFETLLAETGFEGLSVQDVTQRAQINRATFYAHFQDKYALLDYWIDQLFRQEIERRMLNGCEYTAVNLRSLLRMACEVLTCTHSQCSQPHPQFEALIGGKFQQLIFDLLSLWLRKSSRAINTELPATVATWSIYGLALRYRQLKKRPALEPYLDEALPLVAVNLQHLV